MRGRCAAPHQDLGSLPRRPAARNSGDRNRSPGKTGPYSLAIRRLQPLVPGSPLGRPPEPPARQAGRPARIDDVQRPPDPSTLTPRNAPSRARGHFPILRLHPPGLRDSFIPNPPSARRLVGTTPRPNLPIRPSPISLSPPALPVISFHLSCLSCLVYINFSRAAGSWIEERACRIDAFVAAWYRLWVTRRQAVRRGSDNKKATGWIPVA
jgi:hypothetical protein